MESGSRGALSSATSCARLAEEVAACGRCSRLVAWREKVAAEKRAAYADQEYWGRPVPGFGDPDAWLLIVGLAPAAHGANRTGRMFTGDRSGEWLYRALYEAGLASQPASDSRRDGLDLRGTYVTAAVRCAPPGNRPTAGERDACRPFLERELDILERVRVIVPLGGFAYHSVMRVLKDRGLPIPSPRPRFAHGLEVGLSASRGGGAEGGGGPERPGGGITVIASYHPSQQNTFTGRLTREMFQVIWRRAVARGQAARCL